MIIILIILYLIFLLRKHRGWRHTCKVEDRHIFVTGAANGMGRITAIKLAQRGAKVSIVDVNEQGLEQTKRMCKSQCAKTKYAESIEHNMKVVKCDLADRLQVSKAV